jgi:hypothetical protein
MLGAQLQGSDTERPPTAQGSPRRIDAESTERLVADFIASGGAIKTIRSESYNKWQQMHRGVRGTRSMRGRSK